MVFEWRDRAESFGDDAEQYDRARPGYPPELIDDLVADGVRDVVDVGCGTGIVARLVADRGCDVVGVETDARMAEVARGKGLEVEVARFEEWDAGGRVFDLLTSGQAWHWVEPERGARQAAAVLRSGARLALFWNSLQHDAEVAAAFEEIYTRLAPALLVGSVSLGTVQVSGVEDADAFRATGEFIDLETRAYDWDRRYTTATWLDELPTHSGHRVLPADVLGAILDEVGAMIDRRGGALAVGYRTAGLFGRRR